MDVQQKLKISELWYGLEGKMQECKINILVEKAFANSRFHYCFTYNHWCISSTSEKLGYLAIFRVDNSCWPKELKL